jgi:hypothetical protein
MENILTWQPAYLIKSYPELQGMFSRGENRLLSYLHNWSYQLARKGKDGEWVHLTQLQIADAIDYSVSSVKRLIGQCNDKLLGVIETRSRPIWLTKNFYYTITEYRINWNYILLALMPQRDDQIAVMAQSSHYHSELPLAQDEPPLAQDEPLYKDPFKDPINKKTSLGGKTVGKVKKIDNHTQVLDDFTALQENKIIAVNKTNLGEGRSSVAEKMNTLTPQAAATMGLILTTDINGHQTWAANPAGRTQSRSAWIDQGIALGLWATKDMAVDFQGQVTKYAKNQSWCKSPLDYANSVIKGLLAGDNPKGDRYWEAWRNGHPIGWENLFDWEVQPGVINPAFSNWVETSLFDSNKTAAANSAAAAKEIKFNARELWARFQRTVACEVENAQTYSDRGQAYLPPGALLPRPDQPSAEDTHIGLNRLMHSAALLCPERVAESSAAGLLDSAITAQEFAASQPAKADILAKMQRIGNMSGRVKRLQKSPDIQGKSLLAGVLPDASSGNTLAVLLPLPDSPDDNKPIQRPLGIELLPQILKLRSSLEKKYRRGKAPCDLVKLARYSVWVEHGDENMQLEAIKWLDVNDLIG